MLPPNLSNPFASIKLDDTTTLPPGDVPELHATVLDRCGNLMAQAREIGQGIGLLVVGEAGSGKSHLIAQLRKQFAAIPKAALVAIPLRGAFAGRLWRHLRERLVSELLRQYPTPTHGANGLLRILRNRFPKWAASIQTPSGGLMDWLIGRSPKQGNLEPFLGEFALTCTFDYGLQRVLPKVAVSELSVIAHAWLRGQQLGTEDLERLGLSTTFPSEQQQEIDARNVVISLLRLAGDQTVLLLCIDEVEAIQSGTWDAAALRQFTTVVSELVAETGPRVVATFIRPNLQLEVTKSVEVSTRQKMGQFNITIPPLTWEQTVRITTCRLDGDASCRTARLAHPGDPYWPLSRDFLETTFQKNRRNLTPRHLLLAAQVEFERLKKGGPSLPDPPQEPKAETKPDQTSAPEVKPEVPKPEKTEKPKPNEFGLMWGRHRNRLLEKIPADQFDSILGIGLPWLVQLTESPFVRSQDSNTRLADLNLVFHHESGTQKPVGISFCNHDPRSLWRRLDRILTQWTAAKGQHLGTLVILRFETPPPTEAATTRLEALRKAGVRVVQVSRQLLAELGAFQVLLTAALTGDLTREGLPVSATEYSRWAKGNLSPAVVEFFNWLLAHSDAPTPTAFSAPQIAVTSPKPAAKVPAKS